MAEKKFSQYDNSGALSLKAYPVPGLGGTIAYVVPLTAGAANTTTRTSTTDAIGFGVAVKIKRIVYTVRTAQSTASASQPLNIIAKEGTTVIGTLQVTSEAAAAVCTSSELDGTLDRGDYLQFLIEPVYTSSDNTAATGYLSVLYAEQFDNAGC